LDSYFCGSTLTFFLVFHARIDTRTPSSTEIKLKEEERKRK